MEFEAWAGIVKDKLVDHYSENFEVSYNVELGGMTVPVVFSMRNRQPKSYLGFTLKNAVLGPEACELVFVLQAKEFSGDTLACVRELAGCAEKEYIRPGKDHGFTFISVAVLCESADQNAAKELKKFKLRRDYPAGGGWMLARAAVISQDGGLLCNKDGANFRDLLKAVIAGEKDYSAGNK